MFSNFGSCDDIGIPQSKLRLLPLHYCIMALISGSTPSLWAKPHDIDDILWHLPGFRCTWWLCLLAYSGSICKFDTNNASIVFGVQKSHVGRKWWHNFHSWTRASQYTQHLTWLLLRQEVLRGKTHATFARHQRALLRVSGICRGLED